MQAGRLRHRITIQYKSATTQNTAGEEVVTWAKYVDAWASIKPLRGQEYLQARQTQANVDHRIELRYQAGITPEMRVVFGSRIFSIESVLNVDERDFLLQLMCGEQID